MEQAVHTQRIEGVILGYPELLEESLKPDVDFPDRINGKVGGKPIWLDPEHLLNVESFKCKSCGKLMSFLMQIYAPLDKPHAFHRVLYVFCCANGACHKEGTSDGRFKVFCSQLEEENPYYIKDSEEHWVRNPDRKEGMKKVFVKMQKAATCELCGHLSTQKCGGCKKVFYCSREHQAEDWKLGHDERCNKITTPQTPKRRSAFIFEESEILTEPEELEISTEETQSSQNQLIPYIPPSQQEQVGNDNDDEDFNELENSRQLEVSKLMLRFQKRVKASGILNQVLRYYEQPKKELVIWVNEEGQPKDSDIPKCSFCGNERVPEFQILPQLLYHLRVDKEYSEDSMDWGILTIYTCSCKYSGYREEFLWKQAS